MQDPKSAMEAFTNGLPLITEGQIHWVGSVRNKGGCRLCSVTVGKREDLCVQEYVEEEDLPAVSCRWKELRNAGRKLSKTHHQNIQRFYGAHCSGTTFSIILEHGIRGTCDVFLEEVMTSSVDGATVDKLKCKTALQVVDGMEYLHGLTPSIVHLHLTTESLIVTKEYDVKISSFEHSVYVSGTENLKKLNLPKEFEGHLPPESGEEEAKPSQNFGKVWEQFCGQQEDSKDPKLADDQDTGIFAVIKDLRNVSEDCLQLEPHIRPSFADLQEMFGLHRMECKLNDKELKDIGDKLPIKEEEILRSKKVSVKEKESSQTNGEDDPPVLRRRQRNPGEPDQGVPAPIRNGNNAVVERPNMAVGDRGLGFYWRLDDVARRHPVLVFLVLLSIVVGVSILYFGIGFKPPTCGRRQPPANEGSANCYLDKRNVQVCEYFCPKDSGVKANCGTGNCLDLEPPITAYCLEENVWSMDVPYCQKEINCSPFVAPIEIEQTSYCANGDAKWKLFPGKTYADFKNGTSCFVHCLPGYNPEPVATVSCMNNGDWDYGQLRCEKPVCPHLKLSNFVSAKCTENNVVGSLCEFSCTGGRVMTGPPSATCQKSLTWSEKNLPSCECPRCKTGPNCQYTTNWQSISGHLGSENQVNYAGHDIVCKSRRIIQGFKVKYRCECSANGTSLSCGTYQGAGGSCEHSLAELIRRKIASGEWPKNCNEGGQLQTGC